jgi:hypothetical protein
LAQVFTVLRIHSAAPITQKASASLFCPPLPAPTGAIIEVHNEQELWEAANSSPAPAAVHDLHVIQASLDAGQLSLVFQ